MPVAEWPSDPAFVVAEKFVRSVKVVNDAAERGVKLVSDFATRYYDRSCAKSVARAGCRRV